jgi:protein TonB
LKKEPLQTTDAHPTNGTEPQTSVTDPVIDNGGDVENPGTGTGTKLNGAAVTEAERAPDKLPSLDNMASFLRNNIRYPYRAKEEGISGSVWVNFIIDEEGNIVNANILHGAGYGFDEEALRVIKLMPKWKPGMKNGKPVKVSFTQAIAFRLQ